MTARHSSDRVVYGLVDVRQSGGSSLGTPRAALSEVQICGIPKPNALEVASTP